MIGRLLTSRAVLRRVVGRVLAAPLAALVGWIGPEYLPVTPGELREAVAVATTLVVYGLAHKLIDAKVNPADDAGESSSSSSRSSVPRPGTRRR